MVVACTMHMLPHLNRVECDCEMLGKVVEVLILYDKKKAWNVGTTLGHYFEEQLRLISRPGKKRNGRNR